jgi:hypothetical protein
VDAKSRRDSAQVGAELEAFFRIEEGGVFVGSSCNRVSDRRQFCRRSLTRFRAELLYLGSSRFRVGDSELGDSVTPCFDL